VAQRDTFQRKITGKVLELGTIGVEGQQLLAELRRWWQSGVNEVNTSYPASLVTVSPIPTGINLMDAEALARRHEPGDYSSQQPVVEQIEKSMAKVISLA
jgi:hypothetical protein